MFQQKDVVANAIMVNLKTVRNVLHMYVYIYIQKMPLQMDGDSCGLCLLMVGQ